MACGGIGIALLTP
ncbi:hypothetical protein MHN30_20385 [Pseudoalteromonas sp. OF7H-1]|nr:hypothetical protein [Pseudoalteromonas sp. OF7H-1]